MVTPGTQIGFLTAVDLNKDGKLDLVLEDGPVTVLLGKGDGTFQPPVKYTLLGSASTAAVIGDFNLDGKLDVAVGTANNGVGIFFGDGTGKLSATPTFFRTGGGVGSLVTGDFNADGKPDLAVQSNIGVVILLHQ